jgi:hypothetical protein
VSALRNVGLCGRGHDGLQLMRMSLGRSQPGSAVIRPWRLFGFSILFGSTGCGEPATLSGDACVPETAVAASAAVAPALTWVPDCGVGSLSVTTEAGDLMWSISSDPEADRTPTNRIRSGVIYGVVPQEAHQFGELAPLSVGQAYRVFLRVVDSRGDITLVGSGMFQVPAE